MPMTCLTTDKANKVVNEFLRLHGGMLQAGADDTYLVGPWRQVKEGLDIFTALLEEVGLSLNKSKTRIYIHQSERTDEFLTAIEEKYISEGRVKVDDDTREPTWLHVLRCPHWSRPIRQKYACHESKKDHCIRFRNCCQARSINLSGA